MFVVEGEKDGDRLAAGGLIATTNIEGAAKPGQKAKWRRNTPTQLAGAARVVLLPDHDEPGRAHMTHRPRTRGQVGEVRMLELPGLPAKGDVSDWLKAGHDADEFEALATTAPGRPREAPEPAVRKRPRIHQTKAETLCPADRQPLHASGEFPPDSPLLPSRNMVCAGTRLDSVDRQVLAARSHQRRLHRHRLCRRTLAPHRPGIRRPRPPRRG